MNTQDTDENARLIGETLSRAVAEALDCKRRLGQYAVMWRNGRTVRVHADELPARSLEDNRGEYGHAQ